MASNTDLELGEDDIVGETVQLLLACEVEEDVRVLQPCIFKVPSALRDISPSSYNPRVVSIGPLHREAKNVQAMEARKATFLHNLLELLALPHEKTLKACVKKVTNSMNRIKESYDEMKSYPDVELAKLMVMDGLFILDFFYNTQAHRSEFLALSIIYDLLLMENQIPFFVLQDLFECTILSYQPTASLITIILSLLGLVSLFVEDLKEENVLLRGTPDHILGVLHTCYRPKKSMYSRLRNTKIHSATELKRAGVKFKPNQDPSWPMAIEVESSKFGCFSWSWCKPTLRIPAMCFQDRTESIIRNLIVYEQCSSHVPYYVTSYANVIDKLVDSKEDIVILMDSGVIINNIGSNEEAANIINSICKETIGDNSIYNQQWAKINEYYNGYWTKHLARLKRTYFSNPWSIIALLAGIVLFALAFLQTIFTIKAA